MALQASPGTGGCPEYYHQAPGPPVSNAESQASCSGLVRVRYSRNSRQDLSSALIDNTYMAEEFHEL